MLELIKRQWVQDFEFLWAQVLEIDKRGLCFE